jgi:hypothetical protein
MADQFRELEAAFNSLIRKFREAKISKKEFIDSLKELRLKDDQGRFWMIGARSGKWYCYQGNDWVQAKPPSFGDRKAICIYCGYENELESETCARCGSQKTPAGEENVCPNCGTGLETPGSPCPSCEAALGREGSAAGTAGFAGSPATGRTDLLVRSLHPASFFWFSGVLGLFAGLLLGLLVGVTSLFPGIVSGLPGFFAEIQGKLLGGIVFTVSGGLLGFVAGGAAGFVAASAANGILSLIGGVRIGAARTSAPREDKTDSVSHN